MTMNVDRFGRSAEQQKSDQRAILESALSAYPEWVDARPIKKDTAARFDIHYLIDSGLIENEPTARGRAVIGDPSFVPCYRLTVSGMSRLRQPHWLDQHFPRIVNVHAFGSSVNINSPHASASAQVNVQILAQLRSEIERAPLPAEEKAGLLQSLDKLIRHPLIIAILAKIMAGGL